ncbi:FAD-dependent oxidoreductase [Aeromicrobium wangtongii]|uniref:FAD-dependent oxidoreductase n=1 Tax=Aeromicrobium wangtongii TaxID=2969247 RepID=A0ABY5MAN4_9ACTN|nr:FAD-dependent oxidoreductase [Aeromicrobium wangtongii]MCD9199673.1 FAD-dependent oxidoreductase [Aeromicrobium wangtongii]UUP14024.1 FAD-dependent oxidoreductase [Aeromicrobium wangtongii]
MSRRVVVIGGDAAGMTVAAGVRRRLPADDEVIVLERGRWTSYSACGIPYWIAGDVASPDALVARTPEQHRAHGIDVRLGVEAVGIDPGARTVSVAGGDDIAYDRLVIATGAEPVRPDLPGIDGEGIHGVQSLDDGQVILDELERGPARVVVVGSGYIGLEMAEACVARGFDTTVIERAPTVMPIIETPLGEQVAKAMLERGIRLRAGAGVTGFVLDAGGRVAAVRIGEEEVPADLVILGLGVTARSALAKDAGLPLGAKGGIVVDDRQRVTGFPGIWAAGDCVVSRDRLTGDLIHLPLGTHANKQGMVAADSIAADLLGEPPRLTFPGVVQTAITKFCSLEISRTGLGEQQARDAGFDPVVVSIETTTVAGYMPEAGTMTVVMVADRGSRRLLGAQIVGAEDAALRIDVAATALATGLTVDDVVMLDLAYAPPFASVWSPVQVAARAAVKALAG